MKKKIILTESQYTRLQEFLFENKYDNIVAKLEQTKGLEYDDKLKAISKILGTKNDQQTYTKIETLTSTPISDLTATANSDKGLAMVNSLITSYQQKSQALNQQKSTKKQQPKPNKPAPAAAPTQNTNDTDINHTLDFANNGDILTFKTNSGYNVNINVVSSDQNNNEILGTNKGNKIKLTFNSFDDNTKKLTYLQLDNNTNKYVTKEADVIGLDIIRNGKILQIPKAGTNNYVGPTPNTQTSYDDETSYTYDLDVPARTEKEKQEKIKKEKTYGKKALETIVNDPTLQAAFYRQPSFWKTFMADLQGKTAPGKGIVPTLDLINGYVDKKKKEKNPDLSPFKMNRKAEFMVLETISFKDDEGNIRNIPANTDKPYFATNTHGNYFDKNSMGSYENSNMLQSSDKENKLGFQFRIMVKPPAIKDDTFKCDIIYNSKVVFKDARIRFLQSNGYYHDKK